MKDLAKKHQAAPTAVPKVYDGSRIVPHPVQAGQSLSKIAEIYLFKSWQPIFIYNSEVCGTIGKEPSYVREGVTIFIPRTAKGYSDLIKRLERTKREAQYRGDSLLYELEGQEYEAKAFTVGIDFWADVFTSVASLGLKAASMAKATKAVEAAKGQAKIAQQLSANAITREFAEKFAEVRSKRVSMALKATADKLSSTKDFYKSAGQKVISAGAEVADRAAQKITGEEEFEWFSKTCKTMLTLESAREAWRAWKAAKKVLDTTVDVAGIALDYLKPSSVAEFYLWATTGETLDATQKNSKKTVKDSVAKSIGLIDASIEKYQKEMKQLYGSS